MATFPIVRVKLVSCFFSIFLKITFIMKSWPFHSLLRIPIPYRFNVFIQNSLSTTTQDLFIDYTSANSWFEAIWLTKPLDSFQWGLKLTIPFFILFCSTFSIIRFRNAWMLSFNTWHFSYSFSTSSWHTSTGYLLNHAVNEVRRNLSTMSNTHRARKMLL